MRKALILFVLIMISCQDQAKNAQTCLDLGDFARAQKLYEPLLDQEPSNLNYRLGYAIALYSQAKSQSDSLRCPLWSKADQALTLVSGLDSSSKVKKMWADAQIGLADCEIDQAQMDNALDLLDLSLKLDSTNVKAWDLKAFVFENTEKWTLAIHAYEQMQRLDSQSLAPLIGIAKARLAQKDTLAALDMVIRGLKKDSTSADLQDLWLRIAE